MNTSYSLTSKFQVTIPKQIREELGLTSEDRVEFERRGNDLIIRKARTMEEVAIEMHEKFVRSGRKPATDEEIKHAREKFYQEGGKW